MHKHGQLNFSLAVVALASEWAAQAYPGPWVSSQQLKSYPAYAATNTRAREFQAIYESCNLYICLIILTNSEYLPHSESKESQSGLWFLSPAFTDLF